MIRALVFAIGMGCVVHAVDGGRTGVAQVVSKRWVVDPDGRTMSPEDGGDAIWMQGTTLYEPKVFVNASDGGQIILAYDELYDLVQWAMKAKAREDYEGACVPDWSGYPYFSPNPSFTVPRRLEGRHQ